MAQPHTTWGDTRDNILRIVLTQGPVTTADISSELHLAAAGVRRHLDNLVDEGLVESCAARTTHKGRGRPAKAFRLTAEGRARFGHDYDNLAALAVETLRETGGEQAVKEFARKRARAMLAEVRARLDDDSLDAKQRADTIAEALTAHGYAAEVRATDRGVQLCQHHCPISQVAQEHPELCEAEHEALAELFGQHIQPLASIAGGHDICTTHIPSKVTGTVLPLTPITHTPSRRERLK